MRFLEIFNTFSSHYLIWKGGGSCEVFKSKDAFMDTHSDTGYSIRHNGAAEFEH